MVSANNESTATAELGNTPFPEVILPSQYFDTTRADLSPIQRLLLALLQDCLECAMNLGKSYRVRRLRREAHHWLFAADVTAPLTFEEVCASLNIEPDYLRKGVTRWLKAARTGCVPAHVPYRQNTRRHDVVTVSRRRNEAKTARRRRQLVTAQSVGKN